MRIRDEYAKRPGIWSGTNKPDLNETTADMVIFGIPFDKGVSYRGGAAEAPRVLRENTVHSTPFTEEFRSFQELSVYDGGDFLQVNQSRKEYFQEISVYVEKLVAEGKFFIMVGGDHSVTIPVQRGIDSGLERNLLKERQTSIRNLPKEEQRQKQEFGIIHIDAHFDLCDELEGDRLSHGSTERRALELDHIGGVENLYFIGVRSIEADEYQFKRDKQIQVKSAYQCHEEGISKIIDDCVGEMKKFPKVYITLDIDCLDPAFAAGTGTPQFGGLYSRQLLTLIKGLFGRLDVLGMDVVEISPQLDPSLASMFAGRKVIQEVCGCIAEKIGKLR